MTSAEFLQMKADIAQLKQFMTEKQRQQISYPLDQASKNIINDI